jgi:hypothetical protein
MKNTKGTQNNRRYESMEEKFGADFWEGNHISIRK